MTTLFLPLLAAFAVSCLLTRYLASARSVLRVMDHPNERSLHDRPTPRTGGLAVLAGVLIAGAWLMAVLGAERHVFWVGLGMLVLATVSFLDDRLDLPAALRILVHLGVAIALAAVGMVIQELELPGVVWSLPVPLAGLITVGYVVWMINLYNFMDGMDGFAGGMTAIGFGAFGLMGWMDAAWLFAAICWAVAASAVGFLIWNFPPARIFMGDAGSSTLGFLVAAFSLWADQQGIAPIWVSILVFSPFIIDATVTLLRRALRGEPIWQAHRSHYYQRLAMAGWGHRRTVLWEYTLMLACAASAILVGRAGPDAVWPWLVIAGWIGVYLILALAADRYAPFGKEDVTCQGS